MNYSRGFIAPVVLIILAVLLLGGGAYVWTSQNASPQLDAIKNFFANEQATSQIADWQTYRNEQYGFEFKYPPTVAYSGESYLMEIVRDNPDDLEGGLLSNCLFGGLISARIQGTYSNKLGYRGISLCISQAIFEETSGTVYRYGGMREGEYAWFPIGQNSLRINNQEQLLTETDFRLLVASVKIMYPPTAGWKAYRNEEYGFSFTVPDGYSINASSSITSRRGLAFVQNHAATEDRGEFTVKVDTKPIIKYIFDGIYYLCTFDKRETFTCHNKASTTTDEISSLPDYAFPTYLMQIADAGSGVDYYLIPDYRRDEWIIFSFGKDVWGDAKKQQEFEEDFKAALRSFKFVQRSN
ncbi:hypothetical protein HYV30_00215 [Candidatus Kaiserbacteria bacterium]|nr:hypothetical protein [Candidatus Kaiserbacteria bacterium]